MVGRWPPLAEDTYPPADLGVRLRNAGLLLAMRGGSDAAALVSTDGQRWTSLALSGDIPTAQTQAVLLPGGVVVSDGATTWFGQAVSR